MADLRMFKHGTGLKQISMFIKKKKKKSLPIALHDKSFSFVRENCNAKRFIGQTVIGSLSVYKFICFIV